MLVNVQLLLKCVRMTWSLASLPMGLILQSYRGNALRMGGHVSTSFLDPIPSAAPGKKAS